jgi:hypothetical protein
VVPLPAFRYLPSGRLLVLAVGTVVAVLFATVTPARAVVGGGRPAPVMPVVVTDSGGGLPAPGPWSARLRADAAQVRAAVRLLQPYVHRTPRGTFAVNAPKRVLDRIPAGVYAQLARSSGLVNRDIAAGRLLSLADGRIVLPAVELDRAAVSTAAVSTAAVAAGPGTSSVTVQWWGVIFHLDHDAAAQLIGSLSGAATVTSILTVLVGAGVISSAAAIPLSIISGVLALVSGALQACQSPSGMDVSITWLVFGWCTPARP